MLKLEEKLQVFDLLKAGISVVDISRRLGWSQGTIYKYKKILSQPESDKIILIDERLSNKIINFTSEINEQINKGITNCSKIYKLIKQSGYTGCYALVNKYVRAKFFNDKEYKRSKIISTAEGEQAQVDWAYFGKIEIDGKIRKLYTFVYILSYSRAMYVEFVIKQDQQTIQKCHINAFNKLGIPKNIVYDNIKTVILSREKLSDGKIINNLNPSFVDFSKYYGFEIVVCHPYWPRSKGKVESSIKYIRNDFAQGLIKKKNTKSLFELNRLVTIWVENTANTRIHKTTNEKPISLWEKEKKYLTIPEGLPEYKISPLSIRNSTKDGILQYKTCLYSVPTEYSRKKLYIREINNHGIAQLEIFFKHKHIATHKISFNKGQYIVDEKHATKEQFDFKTDEILQNDKIVPLKKKIYKIDVAIRKPDYYNFLITEF